MQSKVSIILPIYNAEKYLKQCLDTVINQTLREIEIICVNDGSTDGSLNILNKYKENDNRVVIINKKNAGMGAAYNSGLDIAKGEYIGFVEPDDYISFNMYQELYEKAVNYKSDIVKSDWFLDKTGFIVQEKKYSKFQEKLYKNSDIDFKYVLTNNLGHWSGLYKKSFIDKYDIKFTTSPGAAFQDIGFFVKTFLLAKTIYIIPRPYYYYRVHEGQSVAIASKQRQLAFNNWVNEINYIIDYFTNNKSAKNKVNLKTLNRIVFKFLERPLVPNKIFEFKQISKILNAEIITCGYTKENFTQNNILLYNLIKISPFLAWSYSTLKSVNILKICLD